MLRFSVTYQLREFLALVRSHALMKATPRDASIFQQLTTRLLVAVVGTTMYLIKSRRIGTCDFEIDGNGITRVSKQGTLVTPWDKVTALHTYETGFILEVGAGGMPVPFRVLSPEQRKELTSLVARHTAGAT